MRCRRRLERWQAARAVCCRGSSRWDRSENADATRSAHRRPAAARKTAEQTADRHGRAGDPGHEHDGQQDLGQHDRDLQRGDKSQQRGRRTSARRGVVRARGTVIVIAFMRESPSVEAQPLFCSANARSAAAATSSGLIRLRQRKSPGSHVRCRHGRQGSGPCVDRFGEPPRIPPRHRALGQCRAEKRDDRRGRRRRDMERPLSPPIYNAARAMSARRSSTSSCGWDTACRPFGTRLYPVHYCPCGAGIRRSGGQDESPARIAVREVHDERREVILRPPPERIAGADMKHDELVVRTDTRLRQHVLDPLVRRHVLEHLDSVTRSIAVADPQRCQQLPLLQHGMLRERSSGRATTWVYIQLRPAVR